ncbi:MAG: hypothetical protein GY725_01565 [bacterium]|nr:hypothetical protein [bacterium]
MRWSTRPDIQSWKDTHLAAWYLKSKAALSRGGFETGTDIEVHRTDYRDSGLATKRSHMKSDDGNPSTSASSTLRPDGPTIDPRHLPSTPTLETLRIDPNRIARDEGTAIDPRFRSRTPQLIPPMIGTGGIVDDAHTFDPQFGPAGGISREELAERLLQERQERELQRRNSLGNPTRDRTLDPRFLADRSTLLSPKQK